MQLTKEQRVFVVNTFNETKNVNTVMERFIRTYERTLTAKTVRRTILKFQEHGTILNRNKGNSGRLITKRTAENIELVRHEIKENEQFSSRRNGTGISRTTLQRIIKNDLNYFPYKSRICHELLEGDFQRRVRFCRWFLQKHERFIEDLIVTDEAAFHMNGLINKQNNRKYSPKGQPPQNFYEKPISREKISVWMGLTGSGLVIGPLFYEGNMTGEKYLTMLNEQIIPQLRIGYGERFERLWFMQDGAPCHRTLNVKNFLKDTFGNRVIGVGHDVEWPPRSPDLTACDFFLWGYLKGLIYRTPPTGLDDLRNRIIRNVNNLKENPQIVKNAMRKTRTLIQKCIAANGGHWI